MAVKLDDMMKKLFTPKERAAIRRDAAVEDMHQRRLAGAIVTDDAHALTG